MSQSIISNLTKMSEVDLVKIKRKNLKYVMLALSFLAVKGLFYIVELASG